MHPIDYVVLVLILVALLCTGFLLSRISSKDTSEFLVAGRKMPWWLIGFSDIAVGLNTSSMLQDSRKVRQDGVVGLMHMWGFALKSCIVGVFFDRLWRRARFKTQMEFYEARYSGWQAKFARIYDTVIFGGFVTSIWASVGLVGIKKLAVTVMGLPPTVSLGAITVSMDAVVVVSVILIALTYSAASGARGIYWTDLVEFTIAVVALYSLFGILYYHIGGSVGLRENLESLPDSSKYLSFLQPLGIVYIGVFLTNPLLDHGGFNPGMQRTLSLKDEREVLYTMIFKNISGFILRSMPFIAIGLFSIFFISDSVLLENFPPLTTPGGALLPDFERAFPLLVQEYLPIGLTGLMTAAFLCAFMSSFDSNIHLTGAVLVNDLYRPYLAKGKDERHYVLATKVVMTLASLVTILIGIYADDILYLGYLAVTVSLGAGWIKLLRIIWWRTNGTADVASQISALFIFAVILSPLGTDLIMTALGWMGATKDNGVVVNDAFLFTRNIAASAISTTVGLILMAVSKPEPMHKLCSFYRRMRPFGFWGPVRAQLGDSVPPPDPLDVQAALVLSALAMVWGAFFAMISFLVAFWLSLIASLLLMLVGAYGSYHFINRLYPKGQEIAEYDEEESNQ
jgi:SSS family solute:Na+ symporter